MEFVTRFHQLKNGKSFSISNRNFKIVVEKDDDIYFYITVTNQKDNSVVLSCKGWHDDYDKYVTIRRDGKLSFKDRDISTFIYVLIMQKASVNSQIRDLLEIDVDDFNYIFDMLVECCKEVNELLELKF